MKDRVTVRLPAELIDALERFIGDHRPVFMTRPEALREAFKDWATGRGYVSPPLAENETNTGATHRAD